MTLVRFDTVTDGIAVNLGTTNGADVYVTQDTLVASTGSFTIFGASTSTGQIATIAGEVVASSNRIAVAMLGDLTSITVTETGQIGSVRDYGVYMNSNALLNNAGTISGLISVRIGDGLLINSGTIMTSGFQSFPRDAIQKDGSGALHLVNTGLISSAANALAFTSGTTESQVENYGTMVGNISFVGADAGGTILNAGLLAGDIDASAVEVQLTNSGEITGAYIGSSRADFIINSGSITGDVDLGRDDDTYLGKGIGTASHVSGGTGEDTLKGGNLDDSFDGGDGADILKGWGGNDMLLGGISDDMIYGNQGRDTLSGGTGLDMLDGGAGDDALDGDADNDRLYGRAGADHLEGGLGDDALYGGADDDQLDGQSGNDLLNGGSGNDVLSGGSNRDTLLGGRGDDALFGGNGRDILNGNQGDDSLSGGASEDIFVFGRHAGNDIVQDFENNIDMLDFSAYDAGSVAALKTAATDVAGGVLFDLAVLGGIGTVLIEDISRSDLTGLDLII
ncbi:calcium-binding protein [Algirhabdus cladophorae]|uniref:calcium-binding protein n=1 Tax=Algirhabdus cladophorae TaxID=3377108 RepID=UPI003B84B16B